MLEVLLVVEWTTANQMAKEAAKKFDDDKSISKHSKFTPSYYNDSCHFLHLQIAEQKGEIPDLLTSPPSLNFYEAS